MLTKNGNLVIRHTVASRNPFQIILIVISLLTSCIQYSDAQEDSSSNLSVQQTITTTANPATVNIISSKINKLKQEDALKLIRDGSSRFGRDIHYGTQEATCLRSIRDQYDPGKGDPGKRAAYRASIVSNSWPQLHVDIVNTVNTAMSWHRNAVETIARAAEELAGNHTFKEDLNVEYIDVHRIQNIDEDEALYQNELEQGNIVNTGNSSLTSSNGFNEDVSRAEVGQFDTSGHLIEDLLDRGLSDSRSQQTEILPKPSSLVQETQSATETSGGEPAEPKLKELKLKKHKNFGDVSINTEESAVHTPVHIYAYEPKVMNGIAWSEGLTKVFRDNFVRNAKLTNQYFAAQSGFIRLYPAQKWQIEKTEPDLYDARVRPWYVAGATSRKDVIILVDFSGSMTGSRRDIAKGVVFEILDTLTDNDNFLILRFSDFVQQVGVPSCPGMRVERQNTILPKHTMFQQMKNENETDVSSFFLLPATGRNIRHVKTNFTIPTSGIANFTKALVTAFEILLHHQSAQKDSQCNQAIMLITDGSPSDFEEIFNRYNYLNAPIRVFTYLIGREAGDVTHTKMMACRNRGYYTHVINLAEVRETVQHYIPVMARPLVLSGSHPVMWTPAYGELTYQILTDWIWESERRDKARTILAKLTPNVPDIKITNDDADSAGTAFYSTDSNADQNYELTTDKELDSIDLFGYQSNPDCFWQTTRNDLLTTVVQPVFDRKNESIVTEKFLLKNVWTIKETVMRTAEILGVAAADMQINDIIALAPSHKLGPNSYVVMLTNNGFVMHHPDLKSILEPFTSDPVERDMRILKPYFSSMDFSQIEHILEPETDEKFIAMRKEAVSGVKGWRELYTKRTLDCQKRVQSRNQSFYYDRIQQFPFSFMVAIPQPYGSQRVEAQIEVKSTTLPEKLTTYFTASDYDIWTVHPDYQYCEGPSNNTVTTLLDMFQRIEARKLDDIQWKPSESKNPPVFLPGKIVCEKDLVQSLVYDAVATFFFSDNCGLPSPNAETSLLGMFGVRFSFIATRSGLTRVRHFDANNEVIKKEALAFAKKYSRTVDETFYSRTVDYNMLIDQNATLIQVPFNTYEKIAEKLADYDKKEDQNFQNSAVETLSQSKDMTLLEKLEVLNGTSLYVIATQSIIVKEGEQSAVAGVSGIFYDYASFVLRFFNSINSNYSQKLEKTKQASCFTENSDNELCDEAKTTVKCGLSNDTIDCLLVDNNGYIVVSERLDFIGRHLKSYEPVILQKLISNGVFHEINITDYQAICVRYEEKQQTSSALSRISKFFFPSSIIGIARNFFTAITYTWTTFITATLTYSSLLDDAALAQSLAVSSLSSLLPNKTYLRPCEKMQTLYETRAYKVKSTEKVEEYNGNNWFVFKQVPNTNLIIIIVDKQFKNDVPEPETSDFTKPTDTRLLTNLTNEDLACSYLERESQLYKKKLDSCVFKHPDEENIKICGAGTRLSTVSYTTLVSLVLVTILCLYI